MTISVSDESGVTALNLGALTRTVRQSCVELMADYGLVVTPQKWLAESVDPQAALCAEVDFVGQVQGSLTLCSARNVVLETARCAAGLRTGAPRSVSDWNSELVNQLLGRVKNKLRVREVSVDVGVPRRLGAPAPGQRDYDVRERFDCSAGTVLLLLTASFETGIVLGECSVDDGLPSEGELLLF
jgi:hypothetical protein